MNTGLVLLIVASGATFALGGLVLLRNPRGGMNRLWFLFVVCVLLWGSADIALMATTDARRAYFLHMVGGVGFSFFPAVFVHFALSIAERVRILKAKTVFLVLYGLSAILALLHSLGLVTTLAQGETGFTFQHGALFDLYRVWLAGCFSAGLTLVVGQLRRSQIPNDRRALLVITLSNAIPLLGGLTLDIVFPSIIADYHIIPAALFAGVSGTSLGLLKWGATIPTPQEVAERVSETTGDLVCVINQDGILTFVGEGFRKAVGVEGRPDAIRLQDFCEEPEKILSLTQSMNAPTATASVEVHYRTMKGEVFPVLLSIAPLLQKNAPTGHVLIARDISERRELARRYQETEEKYQHIVESSLDGIVLIQDDRLVFVNPAAVRIFGYSSAPEMMSMSFKDTVAPGSKPFLLQDFDQKAIGESIFRNYEMKGLTKHGYIVDLELSARLLSWNGRPAVLASFRDITERKKLERDQALWFWEQESLMTIDRRLVSMVDLESVLNAVGQHAASFTRAEMTGVVMIDEARGIYSWRGIRGNIHPAAHAEFPLTESLHTSVRSREPLLFEEIGEVKSDLLPFLGEGLVAAGLFPFHLDEERRGLLVVGFRNRHVFSDREKRLLSSLAEKSAIALRNAELYESLRQRERELKRLVDARIETQEEERRRIARELHDGLGQMITAVKFNVEMLEDIPGMKKEDMKKLAEIKAMLDNVMTETREISYDLMPSVLDDFGLGPAIQLFCETISKRKGIKAQFLSHGMNGRLTPALEVNLYRIAQEALNNVVKHAAASTVHVQILRSEESVRLTIEDDGRGFSTTPGTRRGTTREGMGLISMRERVESFGGSFLVESQPGKGTTLIIDVPYHEARKDR